jgi:glycosyltransferase involved in cell wall biosynthesis
MGRSLASPNDTSAHRGGRALRVCHIAATTEGATWLFEQVRDLRDRFGYDVSVILNGHEGALVDRFRAADIRVLVSDFEYLNSSDLLTLPRKVVALARLIRRERFDVVQTHLFHSMVIGRLAAWLADVPVRLSMIAGPFHLEAHTSRWIDGSTQWMDTALIPSCEFTRTLYSSIGVEDDRLKLVYYGPDEAKFDPARHESAPIRRELNWPEDTPVIAMVAYFYPRLGINRWTPPSAHGKSIKCQGDLIRAMPEVLSRVPQAKLVLVGSGWEDGGRNYQAELMALVEQMQLTESVKFLGFRSDVPAILNSVDVAVQASLSENLGGTIEGLLMQRPMVVTRVGGLTDSVIDQETGIVVNPANPADLARGIVAQLENPQRAREMAAKGRQLMLDKFTLRSTVESESDLYEAFTAKAGRGYRLYRSAYRALAGVFVCGYLAFRYWFVDLRLLPALDAGWRPWHFWRLRHLAARVKWRALKMVGIRPEPVSPESPVADNEQFRSYSQPISSSLRPSPARLTLYRLYAFVGRLKLGWGIRRRVKALFRGRSRRPPDQ